MNVESNSVWYGLQDYGKIQIHILRLTKAENVCLYFSVYVALLVSVPRTLIIQLYSCFIKNTLSNAEIVSMVVKDHRLQIF